MSNRRRKYILDRYTGALNSRASSSNFVLHGMILQISTPASKSPGEHSKTLIPGSHPTSTEQKSLVGDLRNMHCFTSFKSHSVVPKKFAVAKGKYGRFLNRVGLQK